jgi:hypothetical protein
MTPDVQIIGDWGICGRNLAALSVPPWLPVERILAASNTSLEREHKTIAALLKQSSQALSPLDDPLAVDFGVHRWMKIDREEAYSDWLAWVLTQLESPAAVWKLFGEPWLGNERSIIKITREFFASEGHEGHTGRIDLGIWIEHRRELLVEVKLTTADVADTEKHRGYAKDWRGRPMVLVAVSGGQTDCNGFRLRGWGEVCKEMRALACDKNFNLIFRAMILGFVGSVEQNILGIDGNLRKRINNRQSTNPNVLPYLKSVLRGK